MSIYQILTKEIIARYGHDDRAYNIYKAGVKHYKEAAKESYRKLCEYFNGSANITNRCIVDIDRCFDVLGISKEEGTKIILMMFDLGITEKQGDGLVI